MDDDAQLWREVGEVPLRTQASLTYRASVLPSYVDKLLCELQNSKALDDQAWQLGIGDGRLRVLQDMKPEEMELHLKKLYSIAARSGANLVIEGDLQLASIPDKNKKLMTRIKEKLDPQFVFVDNVGL
jgi:hypothetical protein